MSEARLSTTEDQAPALPSTPPISAGAMLQQAREAQGLHIAALAVALKVPVKKLEALEADQFGLLPDTVFIRALAASVCRTLKIEAAPVLEKLPNTSVSRLKTDEIGINTPFRGAGQGSGLVFWEQLSKPLVLAVLALLLGMLVLVFFPFQQFAETSIAQSSGAATDVVQLPAPAPATSANETQVNAQGGAASASLSSLTLSSSDAPLALNLPSAAAPAALSIVVGSAPAVTAAGLPAGTGLLILQAQESSWIEVVDARGVVQARKIMSRAEELDLSGALPLSVVLGRADAVQVQVRGKPFDLKPVTKNNVARFEVE